jgi:tetratricopeptide (TPR) repeat protein
MNKLTPQDISFIDKWMQRKFSEEDKSTQRKTPKELRKAIILVNKRKHQDAITKINNYIDKNKYNPMAYILRGDIYDDMGFKESAIRDYTEAINIDPNISGVYDRRGTALSDLGKVAEAIQEFTKAAKIKPKAMYYYNMAVAYDILNDNLSAIRANTKALELNAKYTKAYYNRGISYSQIGDYNKAISDYNKAIELNPEFIHDVYFRRAEAYQAIGENEQALSDYKKTLEFEYNPEDMNMIQKRIRALTK